MYDVLGRLASVAAHALGGTVLSQPETTTYRYDLVGSLDQVRSHNGVIADYEYDGLHRLELLRHYGDGNSNGTYEANLDTFLAEFDYDLLEDGRRSGVTETDHIGRETRIDWSYDSFGRLVREAFNSYDDSLDFVDDYFFDLVSNRLAKRSDSDPDWQVLQSSADPEFDVAVTYLYDSNDRLLTETKNAPGSADDRFTVYEYGSNANATYGGDHTAQTDKTVYPGLDGTGDELTSESSLYNLQNRLARVEIDSDGDGLVNRTVEFGYDSAGLRVSTTTDGITERYLFDSQNPTGYAQVFEETNTAGGLVRSYAFGLQLSSQYTTSQSSPNFSLFFLFDGHGSTRALTDGNGTVAMMNNVAQFFQYDGYGNAIAFAEATAATNNLYSGEWWHDEVGRQWLRSRYYDPRSGRFDQVDPFFGHLSQPLSLHKYLYVHANPIMEVDPTGQWGVIASFAAGALFSNVARKLDVARVGMGYRMAFGFFAGFGLGQFARSGMSAIYDNEPLWALSGQLPGKQDNVRLDQWENNVYEVLKSHVRAGVHPQTGVFHTEADGLDGARLIAKKYVTAVHQIARNNVYIENSDNVWFGTGGYSGWIGNYTYGHLCRDWVNDLETSLKNAAWQKGWEVKFHYHVDKFQDPTLLTYHSFMSVTYLGKESKGKIQTPDAVLDPWPRSRPDVYDTSKHMKIWPIQDVDPTLDD